MTLVSACGDIIVRQPFYGLERADSDDILSQPFADVPTFVVSQSYNPHAPFEETEAVEGTPFFFVRPGKGWILFGEFSASARDIFMNYPQRMTMIHNISTDVSNY